MLRKFDAKEFRKVISSYIQDNSSMSCGYAVALVSGEFLKGNKNSVRSIGKILQEESKKRDGHVPEKVKYLEEAVDRFLND